MHALLICLSLTAGVALGPGDHTRTLEVDGQRRSCLIHVPASYAADKPTPVVLVFHGAGMNATLMSSFCGMNKKADEAGFITVYPNGTGAGLFLAWNSGGLSGELAQRQPDDVKFVAALLDKLPTVLNVDSKRIYATGMSNGGMMCYRLACELGERIAAIAPVSGTLTVRDPRPPRPIPIIHFHGTNDRIVPFDGPGNGTPRFVTFRSVPETVEFWAQVNKCAAQPVVERLDDTQDDGTAVVRKRYQPQPGGAELVLYEIEGGGHTWPGNEPALNLIGRSTRDLEANDVIWDFFQRHPLP
ncbi:MAG: prolyl oligopeptidase family serine peptidase [Pirellulaceae bacterium]|nr:prolyl oligopeptidase family serine peptidase [Pirellulaceae bacterium]